MNSTRFLLVIAITALLGSCTKDFPTPENAVVLAKESTILLEQPTNLNDDLSLLVGDDLLPESSIELFYPEVVVEPQENDNRPALFNPQHTSQPCKEATPSILIPKILLGERIEIIYANIDEFSSNVNPLHIRWMVNGEIANVLSTILELPFIVDDYEIEAFVRLKDGTERYYTFTLNVTHNMPLDSKGFIEYDEDDICVTGPTVGESCPTENGRVSIIVIVDPVF